MFKSLLMFDNRKFESGICILYGTLCDTQYDIDVYFCAYAETAICLPSLES